MLGDSLLEEQKKESVVLYVAGDNTAAKKVYHRVGFTGLVEKPAKGVDPWIEIGFNRKAVALEFW